MWSNKNFYIDKFEEIWLRLVSTLNQLIIPNTFEINNRPSRKHNLSIKKTKHIEWNKMNTEQQFLLPYSEPGIPYQVMLYIKLLQKSFSWTVEGSYDLLYNCDRPANIFSWIIIVMIERSMWKKQTNLKYMTLFLGY